MSRILVSTVMLAAALAVCATPRDLDLSLRHFSAQGRYVVDPRLVRRTFTASEALSQPSQPLIRRVLIPPGSADRSVP
jgi:hypothetical protein